MQKWKGGFNMLNIGAVCEVVNVNKNNAFKSGFIAEKWIGGKVVVVGFRTHTKSCRHTGRCVIIAYDVGCESLALGYAWEKNLKQVNTLTRHISIIREGTGVAFE
ncbi:hypothetical protein [Lysinibacillus phage vB_LspM-01]|nr:hypothetical protein [Lysinibacillus phage vB_LspM-01]